MRILYFDVDCLRPDHLGCYGYHRDTSPHIDALARGGVRFDAVYASDTPCLPSRSALFSGRFGIHTGLVGHGGTAATAIPEGPSRGFNDMFGRTSWPRALRDIGCYTATVSPFGERHGAYHFYAGFNEVLNTGRRGLENADEIGGAALDWLARNGDRDHWFLHINFWDPHTPYRAPAELGQPFADEPLPAWYTEPVRRAHWSLPGPHSAREVNGFSDEPGEYPSRWPRQPLAIDSMDSARKLFDGYDAGVRYADEWIGRVMQAVTAAPWGDECAIIVSGDHGENLGELGVYADHQTADEYTARVPFVLCWPGLSAQATQTGLHYQVDLAATVIELAGGTVPDNWDGESFASGLTREGAPGRDHLVLSQGAWTAQRAVRFRATGDNGDHDWIAIRTYHDGFHGYPELMLFDLTADVHEERDLAGARPDLVTRANQLLQDWRTAMLASSPHGTDPLESVVREEPKHVRGQLVGYLDRLRTTERGEWAELLEQRHRFSPGR